MFEFDDKNTALLVIDMQHAFLDSSSPYCVPKSEQLLAKVAEVIGFFHTHKMPVIFTKVVLENELDGGPFSRNWLSHGFDEVGILKKGTQNVEVHHSIRPAPTDIVVEKPRYSAFFSTRLDNILRSRNVNTVVIVGADTKFCVLSTSRDAQFRDYQVLILSDCIATTPVPDMGWGEVSPEEVEKVVLSTLAIGDGEVITSDEFQKRIKKKASSELTQKAR
jgi:ureidoacrylate peracid hydrolase